MKLICYLLILGILFFSFSVANDDSFIPKIQYVYNSVDSDSSLIHRDRHNNLNVNREDKKTQSIQFKEDERINNLVQIQQKICLDTIGPGDHKKNGYNYSCENQAYVRTAENGGWIWDRVSPTDDHGFCMLHYRRHKDFIDSPEFADQYKQLEYCNSVWMDAYKKGRMPWMAYSNKDAMRDRFIISQ